MYDIACSLHRHLKKTNNMVLDKVDFSIPIFHSYGHKVDCQVGYGPRRKEGIGLTDGECMERLWSYLGKFSKITKEMTPENRVDLLIDGLLHYGQQIKEKFVKSLPAKLKKAEEEKRQSQESLQEILQPFDGVSKEIVQQWLEDEVRCCTMSCETPANDLDKLSPLQNYCMAVDELHTYQLGSTGNQKESVTRSIEKKIKKLKKVVGVTPVYGSPEFLEFAPSAKEKRRTAILRQILRSGSERLFLLDLMKKYANVDIFKKDTFSELVNLVEVDKEKEFTDLVNSELLEIFPVTGFDDDDDDEDDDVDDDDEDGDDDDVGDDDKDDDELLIE